MVADGNRRHHDFAGTGRHGDEAGLRAQKPLPGIFADIVDDNGKSVTNARMRAGIS